MSSRLRTGITLVLFTLLIASCTGGGNDAKKTAATEVRAVLEAIMEAAQNNIRATAAYHAAGDLQSKVRGDILTIHSAAQMAGTKIVQVAVLDFKVVSSTADKMTVDAVIVRATEGSSILGEITYHFEHTGTRWILTGFEGDSMFPWR